MNKPGCIALAMALASIVLVCVGGLWLAKLAWR